MKNDQSRLAPASAIAPDKLPNAAITEAAREREYRMEYTPPHPDLERAVKAWRAYYDACEDYDRLVCTAKRGNTAIAATQEQQRLINAHALERREIVKRETAGLELTAKEKRLAQDIALHEHEREYGKGER